MNKHAEEVVILKSLLADRNRALTYDVQKVMTEITLRYIIYKSKLLAVEDGDQFLLTQNEKTILYFPIYTDEMEVRKKEFTISQVHLQKTLFGNYVMKVLHDKSYSGIVINPYSENKLFITRKTLESMNKRKKLILSRKNEKFTINVIPSVTKIVEIKEQMEIEDMSIPKSSEMNVTQKDQTKNKKAVTKKKIDTVPEPPFERLELLKTTISKVGLNEFVYRIVGVLDILKIDSKLLIKSLATENDNEWKEDKNQIVVFFKDKSQIIFEFDAKGKLKKYIVVF